MQIIGPNDINESLTWAKVIAAIKAGHKRPKAQTSDQFLEQTQGQLLSRAAYVKGLGYCVKSVTVMKDNADKHLPTVHGAMVVFDEETGAIKAVIDNALITNWKTVADSMLGAQLLARRDSKNALIIGAGSVAENLVRAYSSVFPKLETITIWNRTQQRADNLAVKLESEGYKIKVSANLPKACATADMISVATLAKDPVIKGNWIKPGTHIDLIGAFASEMREADDDLMRKGRIFVDCLDTTIHQIGELMIPIANGTINENDVLADLYGLIDDRLGRQSNDDITIFKNGGGAHLDLMTAHCILGYLK